MHEIYTNPEMFIDLVEDTPSGWEVHEHPFGVVFSYPFPPDAEMTYREAEAETLIVDAEGAENHVIAPDYRTDKRGVMLGWFTLQTEWPVYGSLLELLNVAGDTISRPQ